MRHRVSSRLLDGFDDWWQMPVALLLVAAVAVYVAWMVRRDAAELPRPVAVLLAVLRLVALAAVAAAILDIERISEHEIALPSRGRSSPPISSSQTSSRQCCRGMR